MEHDIISMLCPPNKNWTSRNEIFWFKHLLIQAIYINQKLVWCQFRLAEAAPWLCLESKMPKISFGRNYCTQHYRWSLLRENVWRNALASLLVGPALIKEGHVWFQSSSVETIHNSKTSTSVLTMAVANQ